MASTVDAVRFAVWGVPAAALKYDRAQAARISVLLEVVVARAAGFKSTHKKRCRRSKWHSLCQIDMRPMAGTQHRHTKFCFVLPF
eukprot:6186013-Pleurochrysis_carterae.AAC.2